ncbi:uncharacterized protein LOC115627003 [Scaptodrosophila lebanonensis]|uniref:Uncharacterized protein LOC115627003 n=1 Tax=Drosophila lebanonensis TaxID=7225 RepID=A0A6J2TQR7_DROLE|nr:uncharacterized protein LOC115627003 [Scaptodrosophila lebanonensis]XP_030378380.1 uncharacterized protein LOC115627003 [Scaptodrosophila lebanonensis]
MYIMHDIKNLKDPTVNNWPLWLWLWLLLFVGKATASANVSCIAHDTKVTCDCHDEDQAMFLPPLGGVAYKIEIRNCRALNVEPYALTDTIGLRTITFRQVDNLVLNKYALSYASKAIIVEFEQVNFKLIDSHAINGNIEEISFVGGRIELMQPFGLTTTKDSAILLRLDGVTIQRIESQAFKKFAVEQMLITNCHFLGDVQSKSFYELEVLRELSISNNQFQMVHSHAFSFKLISKLSLSNNRFTAVDGEWLEARIRDGVTLRDNDFGATSDIAFRSLTVHNDYNLNERLELRFHNNTVQMATAVPPRPLIFNGRLALSLRQLRYDNTWPCGELDMNEQPPQPKAEFFRVHSEQILFRNDTNPSWTPLRRLISEQCQQRSHLAYIVMGGVALLLLLLLIVLVVCCLVNRRRKRRKMDVVQPEPRTYKETQIMYQIENAGLLKTDL